MSQTQHIIFCRMGKLDYLPAWELQRSLQRRLIDNKRSEEPENLAHVCLLVEHPPVFTLGRSGNDANLLVSEDELRIQGATFVRSDRGGDITYHGPGQIVGYPILDLDRFYTDIHRYLRDLEEVIIRTCSEFDIPSGRIEGRTGVWVTRADADERKICAMGIRCSRWVTMHGFALNVAPDLKHFSMIVPCGIDDRTVTSMESELLETIDRNEVESRISSHFRDVFSATTEILDFDDAQAFLEVYLVDVTL